MHERRVGQRKNPDLKEELVPVHYLHIEDRSRSLRVFRCRRGWRWCPAPRTTGRRGGRRCCGACSSRRRSAPSRTTVPTPALPSTASSGAPPRRCCSASTASLPARAHVHPPRTLHLPCWRKRGSASTSTFHRAWEFASANGRSWGENASHVLRCPFRDSLPRGASCRRA